MAAIPNDSTTEQISQRSTVYTKHNKPLLQYIKIPVPDVAVYDDKERTARELIQRTVDMARKVNEENRQEAHSTGTKTSHADTYYTNKNISDNKKTATILARENLIHGKATATVSFEVPDRLRDKVKRPAVNQMFSYIEPDIISIANLHSINYPVLEENK